MRNFNSSMCFESDALMNSLLVLVLLLSFAFFKLISLKGLPSEEQKARKMKKAIKYMNKYRDENEEFFMPRIPSEN